MLTTISHKELTLLRSAFLNAQIDPKEFRSITKKTLGDTQLFGYEIKYAKRKIYKFINIKAENPLLLSGGMNAVS